MMKAVYEVITALPMVQKKTLSQAPPYLLVYLRANKLSMWSPYAYTCYSHGVTVHESTLTSPKSEGIVTERDM